MKTKKLVILVIIILAIGLIFSMIQIWRLGTVMEKQKIGYEKKFDSIKSFYASMVVPCVPDTAFHVTIPENVKVAWLDYCVAVKLAQEKLFTIQNVAEKVKVSAIEKFSKEFERKKSEADESYNKIERKAFSQYIKENPLHMYSLSEDNAIYIYFGSNDNFWSAEISFDIGGNSYLGNGKCPESFKKLLAECKKANSDRVQIKDLGERLFNVQKQELEKKYQESIIPAKKIFQETIRLAYYDFRLKTEKDW